MSEFEAITVNVSNRVATLALNRPKAMNAMSQQLRQEMIEALTQIESNDDARIVVITGAGRGFCSGTDLSEGLAGFDSIEAQIQQEYKPILDEIANSDKLFISAVNGACAGIGAALAVTCDFTVMADNAFIYLPFAGIGLVPDGGASFHLVHALGYKRALQLFVESGRLQADECLQYGLANKVVAADDLLVETQAWAEKLAAGSPLAQKLGKDCMRQAMESTLDEVINLEAGHQNTTQQSKDSLAAITAFFSKQVPVFTGE
jgi:2-(1,2-epoxy-1,2-dihydrophenyl)acetyl-CoA isomerase